MAARVKRGCYARDVEPDSGVERGGVGAVYAGGSGVGGLGSHGILAKLSASNRSGVSLLPPTRSKEPATMKKELFDELLESVREGGAILRDERKPSRTYRFDNPDIPPERGDLAKL